MHVERRPGWYTFMHISTQAILRDHGMHMGSKNARPTVCMAGERCTTADRPQLYFGVQDGRCKTLDASADGYMRGEGCIVQLLEAFEPDQLAAAHLVDCAAVLYGTAVNQDGRSSSLTVCIPFLNAHLTNLSPVMPLSGLQDVRCVSPNLGGSPNAQLLH